MVQTQVHLHTYVLFLTDFIKTMHIFANSVTYCEIQSTPYTYCMCTYKITEHMCIR